MSFDEDPQDSRQEYPCTCGGNISQDRETGAWSCDTCEWHPGTEEEKCRKETK